MECRIEDKQLKEGETTYICQKCQNRKDPKYFLRNKLHPVWYEVDDNGQFIKDKFGNKIPHFECPIELIRLSMAKKLLIRQCANFMSHRYIFLMEHLCLKGIASPSPQTSQPCAIIASLQRNNGCLYTIHWQQRYICSISQVFASKQKKTF